MKAVQLGIVSQLGVFVLLAGVSPSPDAPMQLTYAELLAISVGRIIGAADACGVDTTKIGAIATAAVSHRTETMSERGWVDIALADARSFGADRVARGVVSCRDAQDALGTIENKLNTSP